MSCLILFSWNSKLFYLFLCCPQCRILLTKPLIRVVFKVMSNIACLVRVTKVSYIIYFKLVTKDEFKRSNGWRWHHNWGAVEVPSFSRTSPMQQLIPDVVSWQVSCFHECLLSYFPRLQCDLDTFTFTFTWELCMLLVFPNKYPKLFAYLILGTANLSLVHRRFSSQYYSNVFLGTCPCN